MGFISHPSFSFDMAEEPLDLYSVRGNSPFNKGNNGMTDKISISFNVPLESHLRDNEGNRKPLFTDITNQGEALGNMLANQTSPEYPPVKLVLWCYALSEKRPLDLTVDDVAMLKKIIEGSGASAIIRGQFLMTIIKAQNESASAELKE